MSIVNDPKFTQLKIGGRLPTPKGIALEVINLTQREDASNHDIAKLIGVDPALSLRIIKAANILLGQASRPVVTVADAVTVLGLRGLRQLVLGISLIVDHRHGPCKQFDYGHFWKHALLTGIIARHFAERAHLAAVEEIFVVGLLNSIGQLVLATIFPEDYGVFIQETANLSLAEKFQQQENKFGFNESELGEAILDDLGFPKIFQNLVRNCAIPENSLLKEASREWRLLHILHISSLMAEVCLTLPVQRPALVQRLKLDAARIAVETEALIELGDLTAHDWVEWANLLGMGELHLPSFGELMQETTPTIEEGSLPETATLAQDEFKLRVLLVEDDPTMLHLLKSMLKAAGHAVTTATNGTEALAAIGNNPPQLLLSDWLMPKMDGLTLCRALRKSEIGRNIYVIILTAQESPDRLVEAFEAGADDYLVKPITPKIFFARLKAAQRLVQLQSELAFDRDQLVRFSSELSAANQRLQQLALTDVLTGLPNRRAALEHLEREWALSQRRDRPLTCMMIDIDHFKAINDQFGHPIGDEALKSLAHVLRQAARTQDVVCRLGGEEFLVICPDTTMDAAFQAAERLRNNVAALRLNCVHPPLNMTISIGIASKRDTMKSVDALLSATDQRLYQAKQTGRNRTMY